MTMKALFPKAWGDVSLMRLVLAVLVIYGVYLLLALLFSDRLIFQPPPTRYRDNAATIKLKTSDGACISALFLANHEAAYTILYSHGNAEDLGGIGDSLHKLRELGYAVFAYDYHGYGTSQGRPSEQHAYNDIAAAYDYLTRELRIPAERIIAYGYSVGSGPAVELALHRPLAGLILEGAFTTAFRVATRIPILPFDRFRNIDKIRKVRIPVLVIHGTDDRIIPLWHGERIFAASNDPKQMLRVEGANHVDLHDIAGKRYDNALSEFIRLLAAPKG
ncbi:MAG: alpha/beta hydrolase [Geobacteraceae bacterium]